MKTHITTLNNMAGTASLAHRRVLKVAQSIGCHEMGLSFYPLKPDYAKEIDKRLDGIIAPLNYGDIVIFQYPSWIGVNYDESFVNKIKSYRDTKLIIFVQDIQKLMFDSEQAILDMEIKTLNKADLLILASKKMHRYLKENGLDEKPVIYQTIWDTDFTEIRSEIKPIILIHAFTLPETIIVFRFWQSTMARLRFINMMQISRTEKMMTAFAGEGILSRKS